MRPLSSLAGGGGAGQDREYLFRGPDRFVGGSSASRRSPCLFSRFSFEVRCPLQARDVSDNGLIRPSLQAACYSCLCGEQTRKLLTILPPRPRSLKNTKGREHSKECKNAALTRPNCGFHSADGLWSRCEEYPERKLEEEK